MHLKPTRAWIFAIMLLISMHIVYSQQSSQNNDVAISTDEYTISRAAIDRRLVIGTVFDDFIVIINKRDSPINLKIAATFSNDGMILVKTETITLNANSSSDAIFTLFARDPGEYTGELEISGDINEKIPIRLEVSEDEDYVKPLMRITVIDETISTGSDLQFRVDVFRLNPGDVNNVDMAYLIKSFETNQTYNLGRENITITDSSNSIVKRFNLSRELSLGQYELLVNLNFFNRTTSSTANFVISQSILKFAVFGVVPVWWILVVVGIIATGFTGWYNIKKQIEKRRKYQMDVDFKMLPKKNEKSLHLGKIAERSTGAYLDLNQLSVHSIVAGATGGGKSIAAQVIVEEALNKGVAVVVFDPTAQWSGMLRKCTDKRMLAYYPKFGLKQSDAKAFNGNVKWVLNAREQIDIKKYIKPGEIQIFALNKLDPKDIDTFVASTIVSVFHSNPQESPDLKLLLVYDEVHRLLSKFGGSGEGFIQIERACREFRKWGIGIMLISQVLSDFVGAIKANINTEVQMRTRDEEDLKRIKDKYGEMMLQALVKASVGVGMFANASYNKGRPYFVNFRPIFHDTRRLSDQELEQYNKYNQVIDDLEDQIQQLEENKVDIFDLKLEMKLALDKLKSGNFNMVDIYLEGLRPRIEQQWKKIGKQPRKRELKLVDTGILKEQLKKAKKEREEAIKQQAEEAGKHIAKKIEQKAEKKPAKKTKKK